PVIAPVKDPSWVRFPWNVPPASVEWKLPFSGTGPAEEASAAKPDAPTKTAAKIKVKQTLRTDIDTLFSRVGQVRKWYQSEISGVDDRRRPLLTVIVVDGDRPSRPSRRSEARVR